MLSELDRQGVGPGLLLVLGGSDPVVPERFAPVVRWAVPGSRMSVTEVVRALDEQIDRIRSLRVPDVDRDPEWCLVEEDVDTHRLRAVESLFAVASGGVGTRAVAEERAGAGAVLAEGCYAGEGPDTEYAPVPAWLRARVDPPPASERWLLDLRTGVVVREEIGAGPVPLRSMRFASVHRPGTLAARIEGAEGRLDDDRLPEGVSAPVRTWEQEDDEAPGCLTETTASSGHGITSLQHLAIVTRNGPDIAGRRLATASEEGFEKLLRDQRRDWARRWAVADVRLPADPEMQRRLRFALYHVWGAGSGHQETAVGARNLTGAAYHGHVFWDTDVFVLPALATIDPVAARSLVRYRLRRLGAAQEHARAGGWEGARFPWESAASGEDVTPHRGYLGPEEIPIVTGEQEIHVSADVAWAVVRASALTRGEGRLTGKERRLVTETARFWASRAAADDDGSVHLRGVMGPDEYHENVDDDAFTNAMARWNLRFAAALPEASPQESARWFRLADELVGGYDPDRGVHEQFSGFFELDPVTVRDIGRPPLAADVLLGHETIGHTQIIKQPDVLMAHVMVPDELAAGSLERDCDYYTPRLAHGSSLSPAMIAYALARAGRPDEALHWLRLALRIDLDDLSAMTSGGVHIGALAGAWQAVVFGFLGVMVEGRTLVLDPRLPAGWDDLEVRVRLLGSPVRIRVREGVTAVSAGRRIRMRIAGGAETWTTQIDEEGGQA